MRIHVQPTYYNPLHDAWRPLPAGLRLSVFDADVGRHEPIGRAETTGGPLTLDLQGWGPEERPDLWFRLDSWGVHIDLEEERLLLPRASRRGRLALPLPDAWDSRRDGPGRVFANVDPAAGLGSAEDPLFLPVEAARAWYRATYWNACAAHGTPGPDARAGARCPLPRGVTFHLVDENERVAGRGLVLDDDGRVYVPIWAPGHDKLHLRLDADYGSPLVLDLARRRVVPAKKRAGRGQFLTITSWDERTPALAPRAGRSFQRPAGGRIGAAERPVEVDVTAEPWVHGNRLRCLVDGDAVYRAMTRAMREAKRTIHLTAWDFDPQVWIDRLAAGPEGRRTLEDLLLDLVAANRELRVRVLTWPNPLEAVSERAMVKRLEEDPRNSHRGLRVVLDTVPELRSQHQKVLVIDGERAFAGGIDFAWGRWDTPDHEPGFHWQRAPAGSLRKEDDYAWFPWHDVHLELQGPVVAALERNFVARWKHETGEELPAPAVPAAIEGGVAAVAARTWPSAIAGGRGQDELTIRSLYLRAIGRARLGIYVEQQYLNSKTIAKALAERLRWAAANDVAAFRMVLVLPSYFAAPKGVTGYMSWLQQRCVDIVQAADPEGRFLRLLTLRTWDPREKRYVPLYIHSKVMLVDDEWLTVGSANTNNRSLEYDSELNVAALDPGTAEELRLTLWGEHARGRIARGFRAGADRLSELAELNEKARLAYEETGKPAILGSDPSRRRVFPFRSDNVPAVLPLPEILF